jgi:hypothetical protein
MKITFQNPTKGPLITIEFENDVPSALGFVGPVATEAVATLRAVANGTASVAAASGGVSGATASSTALGAAGPLTLLAMLFSAGDSPSRDESAAPELHSAPSPAELRCMSHPYDTSAECAAVRSGLMTFPASELVADPTAARASANRILLQGRHSTQYAPLATEPTAVAAAFAMMATSRGNTIVPPEAEYEYIPRPTVDHGRSRLDVTVVPITLSADHNPRQIPDAVVKTAHQFAAEYKSTSIAVLWNPETYRYELDKGVLCPIVFDSKKCLVGIVKDLSALSANDFLECVPTHDALEIHRKWGVAPEGTLLMDVILYDAMNMIALRPLSLATEVSSNSYWDIYKMALNHSTSDGVDRGYFLVAYEHNNPRFNRRLIIPYQRLMDAKDQDVVIPGYITPGVDEYLGALSRIWLHLNWNAATQKVNVQFHSSGISSQLPLGKEANAGPMLTTLFVLAEHDKHRRIYQFKAKDLFAIIRDVPEVGPRLGVESYKIDDIGSAASAKVEVVDGQIKSITIDGHTEWYDLPVNQIEIPY